MRDPQSLFFLTMKNRKARQLAASRWLLLTSGLSLLVGALLVTSGAHLLGALHFCWAAGLLLATINPRSNWPLGIQFGLQASLVLVWYLVSPTGNPVVLLDGLALLAAIRALTV